MIKIPFVFYKPVTDPVDWEALSLPKPEDDDNSEQVIEYAWVDPTIIQSIEPNIGGEGSYIDFGKEMPWLSTLEPDELADMVNGTITIKT